MPEIMSDPNVLTKEQLRKELQRHKITMPPSDSKKDVYVQMYRTHILKDRSEFSSDEDLAGIVPVAESPRKKNKKKPGSPGRKSNKKPLVKEVEPEELPAMDLDHLTNEELAEKLRGMGESIGPVVDSTRKVYLKKLDRLLRGEEWKQPVFEADEFSDQDEPDSPPPQPERIRETRSHRTEVRQRTTIETTPTRPTTRSAHNRTLLEESETTKAHVSRSAPHQASTTTASKEPTKGSSIWLQLGLFAVVAIIVFLILMNMEPAGKSTIGEITH